MILRFLQSSQGTSRSEMGALLLGMCLSIGMTSCGGSQVTESDLRFAAAHSVAFDGVITSGRLVTSLAADDYVKDQIHEQLYYTVGILNGYGGVADLNRTKGDLIIINERIPLENGKFEVRYSAELFVAWARDRAVPPSLNLVVPASMEEGLQAFFDLYHVPECRDHSAHDVTADIFWYYYRPSQSGCSLGDSSRDDPNMVSRFNMALSRSDENTTGKFPEYAKIWEDGRLVVTAVFGKGEAGATSVSDHGISAYNSFYKDLVRDFGQPFESSVRVPRFGPGADITDVRVRFRHRVGEIDIHMFLVEGIQSVGSDFEEKYNAQTAKSDFVSYSGHSGLGANIRALARKGSFTTGQYQIYLVNGCDTFAYVDDMLRDKAALANPGFGPHKFIDIITNAMPSYFHWNSHSNMTVIRTLLGKKMTYQQMLASFDRNQRAVVTGEQDNAWPSPF